jgi:hypothetical protein
MNDENWKDLEGNSPSLIQVLSWHLFGGTEETLQRLEPNTFFYTNPLLKGHIVVSRNPAFTNAYEILQFIADRELLES